LTLMAAEAAMRRNIIVQFPENAHLSVWMKAIS
jgi:hypothetical protein